MFTWSGDMQICRTVLQRFGLRDPRRADIWPSSSRLDQEFVMRRVVKWLGAGVVALLGVALLGAGGVYAASEMALHKPVKAPARITSLPVGSPERGARIATVNGCHECHGAKLEGKVFHVEAGVGTFAGANLSTLLNRSDADLDQAIRGGVGVDGRALWVMPSQAFARLTDQETADLIAHLRTFKPVAKPIKTIDAGPVGRLGVVLGKFKPAPVLVAEGAGVEMLDAGPAHAQGRALARACIECHGLELEGQAFTKAPDLTRAASYDLEEFKRLLRTGIGASDEKLGLMSQTAPARFGDWSDEEMAALHRYLKRRAELAPVE
jgi:cytochrome c553